MFRQLVTPPGGSITATVIDNIDSLFTYHPLQLSAIVETVWQNRVNAGSPGIGAPFMPWSPQVAYPILRAPFFAGYDWSLTPPVPLPAPAGYVPPLMQPGLQGTWDGISSTINTRWTSADHLIYAYVVENTRMMEIFARIHERYMFGEDLETPSPRGQMFWRNLEYLIFGDAMPSMVWTTTGRARRDETAARMTAYSWMFGIDLSHAAELSKAHPYQKPAAANREFIPTFDAFAGEIWRGIVNSKNTSGANDTDPTVIATLARRLYDMMATRRLNGNLSREEFRAVAITSFVHLALLYDSPIVVDLKATASSPEMRLRKLGERVGLAPHSKTKPFFDLAGPFSTLLQGVETGAFNDATGAQLLYGQPPTDISANAELVIDQYTLATGRDLKSSSIPRVPRPAMPPAAPRRPLPKPAQPVNGHSLVTQ